MAAIPATTECHFTKPNTKSTTAQLKKKARGVGAISLGNELQHGQQRLVLVNDPL